MANYSKAILFFNKKAGNIKAGKQPQIIRAYFDKHNIDLEIVEIPKPLGDIDKIISQALNNGTELFVAAGGDGTVSLVSNSLVGTEVPLGIIPLGTGNLLAKELNIPLKLEDALELITAQDHETTKIDTFSFDNRYYLMNISVGVSPRIMESTDSSDKQRLGVFSYLIHFVQQIFGIQLQRISLEFDHQNTTLMASEVLITNIGTAGVDPLIWSEDVSLDDGILDLLVFRGTNIFDILGLLISIFTKRVKLNPVIKFFKVMQYCRIESQYPMCIQADGDIVGDTPIEILVVPRSLKIIIDKSLNNHKDSKPKD